MKVVGNCELEWSGPESVDLILILDEPGFGEFHTIGPFPYSGEPMELGPYEYKATLTAHISGGYVSENHQKSGDPLRAIVQSHKAVSRPLGNTADNQAA